MTQREALLAQAETRFATVTLAGQTYRVREVEADTFSAYAKILSGLRGEKDPAKEKASRFEAHALVLAECVVDDAGAPLLTLEDARKVARAARVAVPLLNQILELSGFGDSEKKA